MVAWSQLFDDDEELGELLERTFNRRKLAAAAGVAQRRRAIAMLSLKRVACGPQGKKMAVRAFLWADHVQRLTEAQFKRRYRLTWASFNKLLGKVTADLETVNPKRGKNSREGTIVPNAVKLAIGLRYLAGGDPQDLFLIYCVSLSYVYKCIWAVVEAVNHNLHVHFPLDEPEKLARLEAEFRAASLGGIWEGQVGAVDGVHFGMQAPSNLDVDDVGRYHVSRKDEYALLCLAVCDAARSTRRPRLSSVLAFHEPACKWTPNGPNLPHPVGSSGPKGEANRICTSWRYPPSW